MATRFRLTSSTTAPAVSPAIQSYTHTQTSRRQLLTSDSSTLTTSSYVPDAADHLVAGDAHHIQFVSEPMSAGLVFTSGDLLKFCIQGVEANAANNLQVQVFVSVVDVAGTTVRATIRSKVLEGFELATLVNSRFLSTTLSGSYTTVLNDRLVVEFSVSGTPTASGGTNGHNASLRWGSSGSGGDLLENDTQTGTLLNPWIEFLTTITFPTTQGLTGTLFTKAPTFFTGAVAATAAVTGTLYTLAPTFPLGVVAIAETYTNLVVVELTNVGDPLTNLNHHLRIHARHTAGTGALRVRLFQGATLIATNEPTLTGSFVTYDYELSESEAAAITDYDDLQIHIDVDVAGSPFTPEVDWVDLYRPAAPGTGDQTLGGILFAAAATFPAGALGATYALAGNLFVKAGTFFTGRMGRSVPTGLTADQIGIVGHSNAGTFVIGYRLVSTQDLIVLTPQGGADAPVWGDPADPDHNSAWSSLQGDEPVGGFRAMWVMLGFHENYTETQAEREAWGAHVYSQITTLFPTVEYIWWSPMNTYFTTNPGDGDAEDLVNLGSWPAVWSGAPTVGPVQAFDLMVYAYNQGYADDYGPWINLTDALAGPDNLHPTEPPDPEPTGQTHGGAILLEFFEGVQGFAGVLFQQAPTFFVGTVGAGAVDLAGTLFVSTASFFGGVVSAAGSQPLTGTLFTKAPTFFTGDVAAGAVNVGGITFAQTPTFFTGLVAPDQALTGTLFTNAPTFFTGTVAAGAADLGGVLFQSTPTFFIGVCVGAGSLVGVLFQNAPLFFTGTIGLGLPSFWSPNPVGYTPAPVAYTRAPVAYVAVGPAGPSPWGATLSGYRFEKAPTFPVGSVS